MHVQVITSPIRVDSSSPPASLESQPLPTHNFNQINTTSIKSIQLQDYQVKFDIKRWSMMLSRRLFRYVHRGIDWLFRHVHRGIDRLFRHVRSHFRQSYHTAETRTYAALAGVEPNKDVSFETSLASLGIPWTYACYISTGNEISWRVHEYQVEWGNVDGHSDIRGNCELGSCEADVPVAYITSSNVVIELLLRLSKIVSFHSMC